MVVQHNISAMNANRLYGINNSALAKSLEKLSSGYAINRAGDNAAGLAVSEKMRAQIGGLTQASKNAEDGISMVQTFEGALQETDSILQRMRTLAVQSANGSYQDDVDREAMQLEFDQLNDELNQIADTDFNGVVALNGGKMADGLEYTTDANGNKVFDYKKAKTDRLAQEAQDAQDAADAEAAKKAAKEADDKLFARTDKDFCGDTVGAIVDDSAYGKADADKIWTKLGLTPKSSDATAPDELEITFTYDGSAWKATGVKDGAGKVEVDAEKLAALATTKEGNGGFSINDTSLNLIFDTHDVKKFDTATVKVQNLNANNYAPQNIGVKEGTLSWAGTGGVDPGAPTIALGSDVTDDNMSAEMKAVLDALNGLEVTATWAGGAVSAYAPASTPIAANAANGITGGALAISAAGAITYTPTGGTALDIATITAGTGGTSATAGTQKFKLNFDSYDFVDDSKLKASTVATTDKGNARMFDEPETEDAPTATETNKVSLSNNFKNAERNLTYTDNMVLQVGARTKDSVEFTFKYSTDGIGDLKANMNCSAREGGLETDKLSLLSQESSNEAIDKIDNAINKISMVRGTFGAIQNRLEHKISNIDTNNENLTAAESRIRDTQMDKEMMKFTASQILSQASQSMLAQANSLPQGVLQLLG